MTIEFTKDTEFGYDSRIYSYKQGDVVEMIQPLAENILGRFPDNIKGKKPVETKITQSES